MAEPLYITAGVGEGATGTSMSIGSRSTTTDDVRLLLVYSNIEAAQSSSSGSYTKAGEMLGGGCTVTLFWCRSVSGSCPSTNITGGTCARMYLEVVYRNVASGSEAIYFRYSSEESNTTSHNLPAEFPTTTDMRLFSITATDYENAGGNSFSGASGGMSNIVSQGKHSTAAMTRCAVGEIASASAKFSDTTLTSAASCQSASLTFVISGADEVTVVESVNSVGQTAILEMNSVEETDIDYINSKEFT